MSQRPRGLIELGVELDRAARDPGRRRRIRLPAARLPSLSGIATVMAVGCTVAVAGFAIIVLGHGRRSLPTTGTKPGSSQPARPPSGDVQAWFAVLRRPQTAADRLPTQIAASMAQHPLARGLTYRSSRRVISTHHLQVWSCSLDATSARSRCNLDRAYPRASASEPGALASRERRHTDARASLAAGYQRAERAP